MKKFIYALFAVFLTIGLAACGGNNESKEAEDNITESENIEENNQEKTQTQEEEQQGSIEVDKNLLSVEITLPASMFGEEEVDVEQVIANAKADGIDEVTYNEDGSITYKMSKAKHKELMEEYKNDIIDSVDELVNGEDFTSILDITYNNSFSEFTMIVDRDAYENSFDGFAALNLGMSGMMYQLFDGVNPNDYKVVINVEDVNSGEVFDTVVYPDDLGGEE